MGPSSIRIFSRPLSASIRSRLQLRVHPTTLRTSTTPLLWAIGRRVFTTMDSVTATTHQGVLNPPTEAPKPKTNEHGKRPFAGRQNNGKHKKMSKKQKKAPVSEGTHEDVLKLDIEALMAGHRISDDDATTALPAQGSEIEVEVVELSSTGDGLAKQKGSDRIYVVPFSVPGDTVKVKVYRHLEKEGYTVADFIAVTKPAPIRDDSRISCQYFATCSGCQFQMLDYAEQLKIKKNVVVKAYRNFSHLAPELVPEVLDTIGSPLQYGYRTKLTPHFDGPPTARKRGNTKALEEMPPVGFTPKTSRKVIDIEECPIGTEAINRGMKQERARMAVEFGKYTKGATILLRESTKRVPKDGSAAAVPSSSSPPNSPGEKATQLPDALAAGILPESEVVVVETKKYTEYKTCITDFKGTSAEYIDDFVFTNPAGFFFQNNNSILPPFTQYIREHILPPAPKPSDKPIRRLIDAYSGSGLFTITQASLFPGGSIGIDIADQSIDFARRNAKLNGLKRQRVKFIAADAPELFKSVKEFDSDETVVVIDPPRKGCDDSFLRQLLEFGPKRVVYVSCNVHTQARDVGVLVRGHVGEAEAADEEDDVMAPVEETTTQKKKGVRYEIESIRGFDFFPQTSHVEGVAVLNRVKV
ncbi:S-adenosyl-L-methionine-dependent methyltransferase [Apodospora peruviana]|uniref:tRNA (uracil(54)-C(5))-methyltransferase n=1 Tax=Apodospora peruviana TaxID=516989 RepID=A0AAE0HYN0_9PEZI|nr:S-adenosyl-L-methionine-dependent methyltransferase [Apodospora peruviana]